MRRSLEFALVTPSEPLYSIMGSLQQCHPGIQSSVVTHMNIFALCHFLMTQVCTIFKVCILFVNSKAFKKNDTRRGKTVN